MAESRVGFGAPDFVHKIRARDPALRAATASELFRRLAHRLVADVGVHGQSGGDRCVARHLLRDVDGHARLQRLCDHRVPKRHDGKTDRGLQIVETFIARDDDTLSIPGSWVVGIHVPHPETWEAVKKGDLNGFSMEAYERRGANRTDRDRGGDPAGAEAGDPREERDLGDRCCSDPEAASRGSP